MPRRTSPASEDRTDRQDAPASGRSRMFMLLARELVRHLGDPLAEVARVRQVGLGGSAGAEPAARAPAATAFAVVWLVPVDE